MVVLLQYMETLGSWRPFLGVLLGFHARSIRFFLLWGVKALAYASTTGALF